MIFSKYLTIFKIDINFYYIFFFYFIITKYLFIKTNLYIKNTNKIEFLLLKLFLR